MNENNPVLNSIYSDAVNVSCNLFNFTLAFGTVENGQQFSLGKIKMSPEMALEFSKLLQKNIETYEKVYGKINELTPEVKEREQKIIDEFKKQKEKIDKKEAELKELNDSLPNN